MAVFCVSLVFILALFHQSQCGGPAPLVKLNDGRDVPSLGLGTWLGFTKTGDRNAVTDDSVEQAVEWAIDAGYRHIDTASIYKTEEQVGRAIQKKIKEGKISRQDIFVTTKLWSDRHQRDMVIPALQESLAKLQLEYIDLYLIHWPVGLYPNGTYDNTDYLDTWQGMIEARDRGLTRSIGVSNFNSHQLDRILSLTPVKPAMLQIEINLNLQQPELLIFCKRHDIAVTAYTPFGSLFYSKATPDAPQPRVDNPTLVSIANKYNKTVTQVTLRYLVELGVIPIPKSVNKSRIEENLDVFDFQLTKEDREQLKAFDKDYRTISAKFWETSPLYPFKK